MKHLFLAVLAAFLLVAPAQADTVTDQVAALQKNWARVKYDTAGAEAQTKAIQPLTAEAAALAAAEPARAEPKIIHGIMLATDASFNRGLASLPKVKQAKSLFEQAIAINGKAMDGAAYAYLGSLYDQVPGWPIGFGDAEKADAMFQKAIAIAPNNIDVNYFYGQHLLNRGDTAAGKAALEKALKAKDRPGRETADAGRRAEIKALLAKADAKPSPSANSQGVNR